jgi:hypothetical protein
VVVVYHVHLALNLHAIPPRLAQSGAGCNNALLTSLPPWQTPIRDKQVPTGAATTASPPKEDMLRVCSDVG